MGRTCPNQQCHGYFKIKPGTGLTEENLPCYCPYCGHKDDPGAFITREQKEYADSVTRNRVIEAWRKDLKRLERNYQPRGAFGIGISMKVKHGPTPPIRYYREKQLETEIICDNCTLQYAIYGVFAYCPDCEVHNSLQILDKNLELAEKEIALAATVDKDLSDHLVGDALENVVSAFDGFGREICRIHSSYASNPSRVVNISFQNLNSSQRNLHDLFSLDLASGLDADSWRIACQCFQKRHLLAHSMGIIDDKYVQAVGERPDMIGRKIAISPDEVTKLIVIIRKLGLYLKTQLSALSSTTGGQAV